MLKGTPVGIPQGLHFPDPVNTVNDAKAFTFVPADKYGAGIIYHAYSSTVSGSELTIWIIHCYQLYPAASRIQLPYLFYGLAAWKVILCHKVRPLLLFAALFLEPLPNPALLAPLSPPRRLLASFPAVVRLSSYCCRRGY